MHPYDFRYELFGVNDLLKKPFTIDSLLAIFDKWTAFTHTDIGVGDLLMVQLTLHCTCIV